MAVSTNDHKAAVSPVVHAAMEAAVGPCVKMIKNCQTNVTACLVATEICNLGLLIPYTATGMNPYDMRVKCAVPPLCYDFSNVAKYLALPSVQSALGVTGHKWSDCNHEVAIGFELGGDWMRDQDYICNWLGNQAWTLALDWPHKEDFNNDVPKNWTTPEVYDAGHMVPRDQPAVALAMLNAFISNTLE
eukprot:gene10477-21803_t